MNLLVNGLKELADALFAKKNIATQYAFVSCNLVHREKSTEQQRTELNTERDSGKEVEP